MERLVRFNEDTRDVEETAREKGKQAQGKARKRVKCMARRMAWNESHSACIIAFSSFSSASWNLIALSLPLRCLRMPCHALPILKCSVTVPA